MLIKYFKIILMLISGIFLLSCEQKQKNDKRLSQGNEKKEIVVGLPPSMHNIMMEKLVKPELEKLGYTVKLVNFSSLRDSNSAISEGSVDLNTAQHQSYLDVYNEKVGSNLVSLVHIPSISASVYSKKHKSTDEIKKGDIIGIPNDPSNTARSLVLLEKLGWITFKENTNPASATLLDIKDNKYNLQFQSVLAELIPRMIDEVDFGVMPGGVAWMSKIPTEYALFTEQLTYELELMVVVRKEDINKQWAEDVKELYKSDKLRDFLNQDPEAKGRFIWPQE